MYICRPTKIQYLSERNLFHTMKLCLLCSGKDRATGKRMKHPNDVIEELDKKVSQETVGEYFINIDSPSHDATTWDTIDGSLKRKGKRRLSGDSDSLGEMMRETSAYIGSELVKSSQLIKDGLDILEVSLLNQAN
ncbi:uncharacterized protein A4U43_C05F1920 [Asparagus officinalis]|uniref:Uncharacterized protein n=1 Tax=Asparagus officinalis TaxID=4686 RepID=A0A5P1ENN0_ASPOF|nr:uncharacterized protein A4U43_C05F1920 [Asparagus officinalis]